jgi:hypothetical protein
MSCHRDGGQCNPRVSDLQGWLGPKHVVPDEHTVPPSGLCRDRCFDKSTGIRERTDRRNEERVFHIWRLPTNPQWGLSQHDRVIASISAHMRAVPTKHIAGYALLGRSRVRRSSWVRCEVSVCFCLLVGGLRCRRWQRLGVLRPGGRVCVGRLLQLLRVGSLRRVGLADVPCCTRACW